MSVPDPPKALEGHCAAINDDVLYFLSPDAFQSLPLQKNATWTEETLGVAVTGAACVLVGDGSDAVLYVIGGTSDNDGYSGLQTYSFSTKTWETLTPPVEVLQGRTNHSAAYLQDSNSILIYAGSQESAPSFLSSQTFLVTLQSPYNIQSYTSQAPPTNMPILEPFNTSHAVLVGGSVLNSQIWTFGATDGWQEYPTNLTAPLVTDLRGIVIDGSDGSKVLQVYDMDVSPNEVSQLVLVDSDGAAAYTGQTVGGSSSSSSSRKRKRDLTLEDWPAYNSTGAPTATRSDYAVVQAASGVAVIAGGSSSLPVAMFNQDGNTWIDADAFFDDKNQQPLQASSTASPASTASSTSSASSSSNATATLSGDGTAHSQMLRTLGITLGVLCSIAAIFILILLFLRWRKMKQKKQQGYVEENEKAAARLSFADRGASFMKEAGGSVNALQPPAKTWNGTNNESHSSLAIIAGKFNRGHSHVQQRSSFDSTTHLVKGKGMTEPVEMVNIGETRGLERDRGAETALTAPEPSMNRLAPPLSREEARERRNRSSGWSKYFATSQPMGPDGLSHLPSAYNKPNPISDGSKYSSDPTTSHASRLPSSVLVPPLDIDFSKTVDGQRLSHVTSGSPAFNDSREDLARQGSGVAAEGQQGLIVDPRRPRSHSESISSYNRSTMSSNITTDYADDSGNTSWTPVSPTFKDHVNASNHASNHFRPTSSVYTTSVYEPRVLSRGKSASFFPGAGTSYRPAKKMSHTAAPSSDWAMMPSPHQRQQQQQQAKAGAVQTSAANAHDSTVTVFPGVPSAYYASRQNGQDAVNPPAAPVNSDLGWLNLGLGNSSQHRL